MAPNPNPLLITDAIWRLWEECASFIPGVRLGGIYAFKSGYHNTVNSNKKTWPGNYSIRLPLDLTQPDNKARAIDLTMDNTQMVLRTTYLRRAALHPDDDRLNCVREFYGTLDNEFVFGLIQSSGNGNWQSSSSDTSHLWHIHISIFTEFCDEWPQLAAVASVLSGETWKEWTSSPTTKGSHMLIRSGADDGSVYYIPGGLTSKGKAAAFAIYPPDLEVYANSGMPYVQLPPGKSVEATGWYDIDPQPWPNSAAVPLSISLSGSLSGTGIPAS